MDIWRECAHCIHLSDFIGCLEKSNRGEDPQNDVEIGTWLAICRSTRTPLSKVCIHLRFQPMSCIICESVLTRAKFWAADALTSRHRVREITPERVNQDAVLASTPHSAAFQCDAETEMLRHERASFATGKHRASPPARAKWTPDLTCASGSPKCRAPLGSFAGGLQ